jgi:hypothetical protein
VPGLPSPSAALLLAAELGDTASLRHEALLLAAGILAGALLLMALVALATSPARPTPGEATMELGPEPPAVVDLLTDDFEVTSEAVPATLLDLAARGWLELESYGPDQTICRLDGGEHGPLLPYERRVLDHLRGVAVGGVVPAEALTTGPEDVSASWWRSFRREVIADAQARGLCRRRWPRWVGGVSWVTTLAAGGLLWFGFSGAEESGAAPLVIAVIAGVLLTGYVAGRISTSDRQRDTPAGLDAGSRWLGVRRYLVEHGEFGDQPAAAVAVWDRYLAHAAAMDLAGLAVQQLPLGAEDDRHAWSAVTGEWRPVVVDYPRFEPGWGRHPAAAIALGVIGGGFTLAVMWASWRYADDTSLGGLLDGTDPDLRRRAGWAALVLCALCLLPLGYAATALWRGVIDCFGTSTMEGMVLRTRRREGAIQVPKWIRYFTEPERRGQKEAEPRWYVAVDTGEAPRVDAWRVRRRIYQQVHQHQLVRVEVRPRLGHVRSVTALTPVAPEVTTPGAAAVVDGTEASAALLAAARALAEQR